MGFDEDFTAYLSQPCDEPGCERVATHNCYGVSGVHGKFCNGHMDWDRPAFARND